MTSAPSYFVLFADMLGFKRVVLDHKVPFPENLEFRNRIIARPERPNPAAAQGNALSRAFKAFHQADNETIDQTLWNAPVSLIVFSDSLFMATQEGRDCCSFAERMMLRGLQKDMPLRMGLGFGSFVPYGFSYEESPTIKYVSAQFFGSGVVYSVEAETGIKGARIAVHPLAAEALEHIASARLLPLPPTQSGQLASHELNYIPQSPDPHGDLQFHSEIIEKLRHLAARAPQTPQIQIQYTESVAALGRMAGAQQLEGVEPANRKINKLRTSEHSKARTRRGKPRTRRQDR